jgi:hypothetical protein
MGYEGPGSQVRSILPRERGFPMQLAESRTVHGHSAENRKGHISRRLLSHLICREIWLRRLDLNQRPLGYEPNGQLLSPIDFNAFSS